MRPRLVLGALLSLACLVLGALFFVSMDPEAVAIDVKDPASVQEQFWIEYIHANGPSDAYDAFAAWVVGSPESLQHTLAHVMGGALYKAAGTEGLFVCTSDYSYGCYHEFLGQAIHESGLPAIETLSARCSEVLKTQSLGCLHGIGHGITGYLGYDLAALEASLDVCETVGEGNEVTSCGGGVFMEFNTQTLLAEQGMTRPYEQTLGWNYPCPALESFWQAPCYFWQTQWWQSVEYAAYPEYEARAARMGERCAAVRHEHARLECFRGIGYNTPGVMGHEADPSIAICMSMPSQEGRVECLAGAAGSILANPPSKTWGYTVCDPLEATDREYCIRTATDPH